MRRARLAGALSWVVVLAAALPASAYSVCNHDRLTREAVQLVDRCRLCRGEPGPSPKPFEEVMVHYDMAQDALRRKLAQWHFPRRPVAGPLTGPAWWLRPFANRWDFEAWTHDLWRRVAAGLSADQLYPALGAALHYVQDVAVPAHAVPVFHPTWTSLTDDFDDYESWRGYVEDELPCAQLEDACDEVLTPRTLAQLLESTRALTQSDLKRRLTMLRDGVPSVHDWSEFWVAPSDGGGGFGSYGCQSFGASSVSCASGQYQVDPEEFRIFATARARAAVRAGASAIVSFQQHLVSCAGVSCEPTECDPGALPDRSLLRSLPKEIEAH